MDNLLSRFGRTAGLLLIGLILILYIGLGFVYFQQGAKQGDLQEQINNLDAILSKPLTSVAELEADYERVTNALTPMEEEVLLEKLVSIAEDSGIDVAKESNQFNIPAPGQPIERKVGEGSYQVLSFKSIKVQGTHENVMAFISNLDSGETLPTLVLIRVNISHSTVEGEGEEETGTEASATLDVDIYSKLER